MLILFTDRSRKFLFGRIVVAVFATILFAASGCMTFWLISQHYTKDYVIIPFSQPVLVDESVVVKKTLPGLPVRLSIPSIGLDATIAHTGLTANGAMDIKENPDEVAWYQFGTRPGGEGSAVIAGHYGWTGLHGSVFNKLQSLHVDDVISVLDENNTVLTFAVKRIEKYDPKSDASRIFQSYDGKAHLNLITCDGTWVKSTHSYSDRLVVFADLE